ncbi:hypothetical protein HCA61_04170 [Rhodococcus sp. HNM0563]|uniref:hypothetical protein n=1 Tax=unclassified Rhodococcus (in: high G+C Gram-positive bacteria) TaxID=192944 RepID=UPI00146A02B0|nr:MULTISPECIES: hypothetical protein [unclassified Rhodococcus (in: high G+C Gram-positive bacteria)]MCK0090249.1 hypothetical protein [Rhodococcus sp. F64268]NLU61457.1 hypothetical protein [Rhodococcus sp. HNM0563]
MRKTIMTALLAGAAALTIGTGVAAAESAPNVVGMEEHVAASTLSAAGTPYSVTNRSGNISGRCAVTAQRDRGYRTEVESTYNSRTDSWDRKETKIWRGIGLTVVCR